jgi:hypothetical protein
MERGMRRGLRPPNAQSVGEEDSNCQIWESGKSVRSVREQEDSSDSLAQPAVGKDHLRPLSRKHLIFQQVLKKESSFVLPEKGTVHEFTMESKETSSLK